MTFIKSFSSISMSNTCKKIAGNIGAMAFSDGSVLDVFVTGMTFNVTRISVIA